MPKNTTRVNEAETHPRNENEHYTPRLRWRNGCHYLQLFSWICLAVGGAGCASLRTEDARVDRVGSGRDHVGLHYFLPKGVITVVGKDDQTNQQYTISFQRHNEADENDRYWLTQTTSLFHDDTVKFKVTDQGLLNETIAPVADPKIEAILTNILDTAINVGQIIIKYGQGMDPRGGLPKEAPPPLNPFRVSFDPFNQADVMAATEVVAAAGLKLEVEGVRYDKRAAWPNGQPPWDYRRRTAGSKEGIFYRPLTPVKVRLTVRQIASDTMTEADKKAGKLFMATQVVPVPDPDSLATYSTRRGAFTSRKLNVSMVDGEPREVDYSHPSELYAATLIPVNLTKKILSDANALPALSRLFWKPKADPNADIKARTARLNAEKERLTVEKEYLEAVKRNKDLAESIKTGESKAMSFVVTDTTPTPPTGSELPAVDEVPPPPTGESPSGITVPLPKKTTLNETPSDALFPEKKPQNAVGATKKVQS